MSCCLPAAAARNTIQRCLCLPFLLGDQNYALFCLDVHPSQHPHVTAALPQQMLTEPVCAAKGRTPHRWYMKNTCQCAQREVYLNKSPCWRLHFLPRAESACVWVGEWVNDEWELQLPVIFRGREAAAAVAMKCVMFHIILLDIRSSPCYLSLSSSLE